MKKIIWIILTLITTGSFAQDRFDYMDVFQIEWVSDPQKGYDICFPEWE